MTPTDQFYELTARVLAGDLPEQERRAFLADLQQNPEHQKLFEEMEALWSMTGEYPLEINADLDQAWEKVETKLAPTAIISPIKRKRSSKFIWIRAAAAAILLLLAATFAWQQLNQPTIQPTIVFQTQSDEQKSITLPDGSKVWLNEQTKLSYESDFNERIVHLEGEAFFDVEKRNGEPFEIKSGGASTLVLGTSFNVRAYPKENQIEVTVQTGKVAVREEKKATNAVSLDAGQSAVYIKKENKFVAQEKADNNATSWKTRQLSFDNLELKEVISAVERYFDVEIDVENEEVLKCHFIGKFSNPKLEEVIKAIEITLRLTTEQNSQQYLFKGDSCFK